MAELCENLGVSLMVLLEINSSEEQLQLKPSVSIGVSGLVFFVLVFFRVAT